jgi:hypothetical protein
MATLGLLCAGCGVALWLWPWVLAWVVAATLAAAGLLFLTSAVLARGPRD